MTTIACRLDVFDDAELVRYRALRAALRAAVTETQALADGRALHLRADPASFQAVAEWVTLERRCCPFLSFALDWPAGEPPSLRLTGGPEVAAFLASTELARNAG